MCNVCCASEALRATSEGGAIFTWTEAPCGTPVVMVRAKGGGPEFKKCEFQVKVGRHSPWPKYWARTKDLASAMGSYGFDMRWEYVPEATKVLLRKAAAKGVV